MIKLFTKWWKYLGAKFNSDFDKNADPAVQLEQALREAQDQHRRLKEQAANVIAGQKQAELRLNAKMTELEKLNATARQALIMASDATKGGDAAKATQYNNAAEGIANQLILVEKDVEGLKAMVVDSTQASDQAKAVVQQNGRLLQQKLSEKQKLLSQLDQAKMQEQMNSAMSQLQETVGDDVPTLNEAGLSGFDADTFFRFRDACVKAGITAPIIPGILPIQSWEGTKRFAARCGTRVPPRLDEGFTMAARDGREELLALAHCTALCDKLIAGGVEDLHFYTLNRPDLTRDVVRALGIVPELALEKVA